MRRFRTMTFFAAVVGASASPAWAQEPNFGRALAMTSTDLFIGQPVNWYGPGVVYTYRLDPAGEWREQSRLAAPDSARMDDFGRSLAVDGRTLIVGAPRKRDGSGVAYAFERPSANADWRFTAIIEPPATGDHSEYASALSLSGDDLLIGSPAVDSTGVVYHFMRAAGEWRLQAVIRPAGEPGVLGFGRALSRHGDWLLVGAPAADSATGRLFFFRRDASGDWRLSSTVRPPRAIAGPRARLGTAVLLDGDRAYIGAPGEAAAFVFTRDSAGGWAPADPLRPFDPTGRTDFGHSLALVGGELWVGAPGVNDSNGRVYRFLPDGIGGWSGSMRIDADSADGTAWPFAFGFSIASSGERAVIGMPQRDFGEGRALVLARDGDAWQARRQLEGRIYTIGGGLAPGSRCENGRLTEFPCANIELVSHMPVSALGGARGVWVNDVWGWTDPETGRDYALVARRDGAAFVDVTDPSAPGLIGSLPRTRGSPPSVWRDIKVLNDHAYIVADGARAHGMQVFDLTRLRAVSDTPAVFEPDATYRSVHSAHNVVADTSSGFLYIVGANGGGESCGGGLHMVDARDPLRPVFAGCYNDRSGANSRGYTHDAQCVKYRGPDARYRNRQICVGSNETEINIADVTDKAEPVLIGRNSYPDVAYAHQGWFDDEQRYFYMNDEGDELVGAVAGTRTIVWDLSQLDDPVVAHEYIGPVRSSDHNLFVKGDHVYESNYGSGLRVLDISDRTHPREVGFLDSAPYNDNGPGHSAAQSGAWSNYPFFRSGIIVFTSVREGLFIVRLVRPMTLN
ncbi:MAG: choice-of-anchor B family protein [Gemmatimonadetes bacterium]|nr:choice-of-anchor B family protein [Gemmatimonadota bacterium]